MCVCGGVEVCEDNGGGVRVCVCGGVVVWRCVRIACVEK